MTAELPHNSDVGAPAHRGAQSDSSLKTYETILQFMARVSLSRTTIFRYMRRKKNPLPSRKFGRSRRVPVKEALAWLEREGAV